ncbi:hypothetical protein Acr_09g0008660 [Actinidia rufa]|uniref:Retrovirus-related Pol polyprotein from transposon TNT 1-94-like beta-barrel domain-containing protein n=1 Tax=Actinidia rufa TaxID=165716 RepID=A0A7J0F6W5_9ERIC|nr:hypothetical protein Acr_09g0008660 [Actinidia rufa]
MIDEIDVLLAASDNGKSDWVLDSGSAYHLCRDREVFSTYAACEGRIWMANNTSSRVVGRGSVPVSAWQTGGLVTLTEVRHVPNLRKNLISIGMLDAKGCSFEASGGILESFQGKQGDAVGKKTGGLYRLEGNVLTGELTVRHGSSGISERVDKGSNRCTEVRKASAGVSGGSEVVQERREMLWDICAAQGRRDGATTTRKVTYFAAHPGGGCGARRWGGARHLGEKVQALRCGSAYTSVGSGVAVDEARYLDAVFAVLWGSWIRSY